MTLRCLTSPPHPQQSWFGLDYIQAPNPVTRISSAAETSRSFNDFFALLQNSDFALFKCEGRLQRRCLKSWMRCKCRAEAPHCSVPAGEGRKVPAGNHPVGMDSKHVPPGRAPPPSDGAAGVPDNICSGSAHPPSANSDLSSPLFGAIALPVRQIRSSSCIQPLGHLGTGPELVEPPSPLRRLLQPLIPPGAGGQTPSAAFHEHTWERAWRAADGHSGPVLPRIPSPPSAAAEREGCSLPSALLFS